KAGRARDEVRLVAVSKTHPPEKIREASACGLTLFGESKVQEAAPKISMCPSGLEWHFIGHLQTNKARRAVELFRMIHSVDSLRLLESVNAAAHEAGRVTPVCIEVNVSGEVSKYGLPPGDLQPLLEGATKLFSVEIVGLMTMPPWSEDPEKARPVFSALRALRAQCDEAWGFPLTELSMGMSHDFEVAIEEGATMIRVGSDLFGDRHYET
ncbi:MAG: YggS family pyridoxal phosphate-dependent enzyme, partial [Kiritimatiellae bacterium]|nr:YggS family pyridoxal phosphate-dependent enzyme [Kiritimatiellia bacterium]